MLFELDLWFMQIKVDILPDYWKSSNEQTSDSVSTEGTVAGDEDGKRPVPEKKVKG